jgi:hypothetical protein
MFQKHGIIVISWIRDTLSDLADTSKSTANTFHFHSLFLAFITAYPSDRFIYMLFT